VAKLMRVQTGDSGRASAPAHSLCDAGVGHAALVAQPVVGRGAWRCLPPCK
jgi:hypothetical protein